MSQLRKEPWGHPKAVAGAPVTPGTRLFTPSSVLGRSPEALCRELAGLGSRPATQATAPAERPEPSRASEGLTWGVGGFAHARPGLGREHRWRASGALSSGLGPGEALRAPGAPTTHAGQTKHQVQRGRGSWCHEHLAHLGLCPLQSHGLGEGDGRPPAPGQAPSVRSAPLPACSRAPACICLRASPP